LLGTHTAGDGPVRLPEGTGIRLSAFGRLVLQVTYAPDRDPGGEDRPTLDLVLAEPGAEVREAVYLRVGTSELAIAAGDADATATAALPVTMPIELHGAFPSMNLFGRELRFAARGPDGASRCLIEIPEWDFRWRAAYAFASPLSLATGDILELSCAYDNSAANQPPGADGKPRPPRDLALGEAMHQERCDAFIYVTASP
jgi:hypothetical protein